MKALLKSTNSSLKQIQFIIRKINEEQIKRNQDIYDCSGIGRHVRHITDHFLALKIGLEEKQVNYNIRNRDTDIEKNLIIAGKLLKNIMSWVFELDDASQPLIIISEIDCDESISKEFSSNRDRELLYLINHTIHHAAYIKLVAEKYGIKLPDEIGIAPCTASFLREETAVY